MQVLRWVGTVLVVGAVLTLFVCNWGIYVIAHKATKLMKSLGGDPPDYFGRMLFWGPVPEFWEYLREQSRRNGNARLGRLARVAEVFLVLRMVIVVPLVILLIAQVFIH